MSYAALKARLGRGDVILLDGPTGTELQRRGVSMDAHAWCGPATLAHERLLTEIHADYIAAGSSVVTANTFAASRLMLQRAGFATRVRDVVRRAVDAALRARDAAPPGAGILVAGSLSHMVPVAEGTAVVDPASVPSATDIAAAFLELADCLKASGCDLILLEMMYNPVRVPLALAAARNTGLPVWFGASARRGPRGEVLSFDQHEQVPLDDIVRLIPYGLVDVAGIMHTGADLVGDALATVRARFPGPLMAYPDSGYFEMPQWRFVDALSPERFADLCRQWLHAGAQLVGGCCGLTPEHIRAAARARDELLAGR